MAGMISLSDWLYDFLAFSAACAWGAGMVLLVVALGWVLLAVAIHWRGGIWEQLHGLSWELMIAGLCCGGVSLLLALPLMMSRRK